MPVPVLATTEAVGAVPPEAGAGSADISVLTAKFREFLREPDLAVLAGKAGRQLALEHYGLGAFLRRWDSLLAEITERTSTSDRKAESRRSRWRGNVHW